MTDTGAVQARGTLAGALGVVVTVVVLVGQASSAPIPTTAASYRNELNGYCRTFTTRFHTLVSQAKKAKTSQVFYTDVGKVLGLDLYEAEQINQEPVPSRLRQTMKPARRSLAQEITAIRHVIALSASNTITETALTKAETLVTSANRALDRVGLNDCGSRQQ